MDLLKHFKDSAEEIPYRMYWIAGTPAARGLAVRRALRNYAPHERMTFDLAVDSRTDVAQALKVRRAFQYPMGFIVRNAHLWGDDVADLKAWLNRKSDDMLVMESGLEKWRPVGWDGRAGEFLPQLHALVKSFRVGEVITEFTKTANGRVRAKEFVQGMLGFDAWQARLCVDVSTEAMVETCLRLKNFPPVTDGVIQAVKSSKQIETYPRLLLLGRKEEAARVLKEPDEAYFRELEDGIILVSMIARNLRMGDSAFSLASRMNVHRAVVEKNLPLARNFDMSAIRRRVEVLAFVQTLWAEADGDPQKQRDSQMMLTVLW